MHYAFVGWRQYSLLPLGIGAAPEDNAIVVVEALALSWATE